MNHKKLSEIGAVLGLDILKSIRGGVDGGGGEVNDADSIVCGFVNEYKCPDAPNGFQCASGQLFLCGDKYKS